jgi:hypothetical protein
MAGNGRVGDRRGFPGVKGFGAWVFLNVGKLGSPPARVEQSGDQLHSAGAAFGSGLLPINHARVPTLGPSNLRISPLLTR